MSDTVALKKLSNYNKCINYVSLMTIQFERSKLVIHTGDEGIQVWQHTNFILFYLFKMDSAV